jgi:hypothetical protein
MLASAKTAMAVPTLEQLVHRCCFPHTLLYWETLTCKKRDVFPLSTLTMRADLKRGGAFTST